MCDGRDQVRRIVAGRGLEGWPMREIGKSEASIPEEPGKIEEALGTIAPAV